MRLFFIVFLALCTRLGFGQNQPANNNKLNFLLGEIPTEDKLPLTWTCRDDNSFFQRDTIVFYSNPTPALLNNCKVVEWNLVSEHLIKQSFGDYCAEPPQIFFVFDGSDEYEFSIEEVRKITLLKITNNKGKAGYFKVSHARVIDKGTNQEYSIMTLVRLKRK